MALSSKGITLSAVLDSLGYTHEKMPGKEHTGQHVIMQGERVVAYGRAHDIWDWLQNTGQIEVIDKSQQGTP